MSGFTTKSYKRGDIHVMYYCYRNMCKKEVVIKNPLRGDLISVKPLVCKKCPQGEMDVEYVSWMCVKCKKTNTKYNPVEDIVYENQCCSDLIKSANKN